MCVSVHPRYDHTLHELDEQRIHKYVLHNMLHNSIIMLLLTRVMLLSS